MIFKKNSLGRLLLKLCCCCSVAQSCLTLWDPTDCKHARLPCPSPTPGDYSTSCPLSQWCHPTISSSVVPFSWLQSFPASESFPMSQLFPSSGQSIGVSASASVLPVNIQDWSPLVLTGLILQPKGLSRLFSITTVQKHQFFGVQHSLCPTCSSIHDHWKNHGFDYMDLCWQSYVSVFKTDFSFYRKTVLSQTDPSKTKS